MVSRSHSWVETIFECPALGSAKSSAFFVSNANQRMDELMNLVHCVFVGHGYQRESKEDRHTLSAQAVHILSVWIVCILKIYIIVSCIAFAGKQRHSQVALRSRAKAISPCRLRWRLSGLTNFHM